jgi:hypothetical protein
MIEQTTDIGYCQLPWILFPCMLEPTDVVDGSKFPIHVIKIKTVKKIIPRAGGSSVKFGDATRDVL